MLPSGASLTYLREFRVSWRYLAAASFGLASGYTLNLYITNTFAPHLLKEFGWSKSQFSLLGVPGLVGIITLPVAGRLTDIVGYRRVATIGITLTPILFIACSRINDNFLYFFQLNLLQVIVGAVTTSLVYSRLIAESFNRSRGLALAIAASAAPATGGVIVRYLAGFIDTHGWRAGYLVVAAGTAVGGVLALLLIPRRPSDTARGGSPPKRHAARDYFEILRSPAFRRIALGMLLCNLTVTVQASQLTLILLDRGVISGTSSMMLSLYAAGVVVGRLSCGVALDRLPTHIVSALSMGLPCVGFFILAARLNGAALLGGAVLTIGLSMGAELDVLAYLVMRFFKVEVYSTVYGLIQPVIGLSAAFGAFLLSVTLKGSDGYSLFLYLAAISTLVGSAFFVMLGRCVPAPRRFFCS